MDQKDNAKCLKYKEEYYKCLNEYYKCLKEYDCLKINGTGCNSEFLKLYKKCSNIDKSIIQPQKTGVNY